MIISFRFDIHIYINVIGFIYMKSNYIFTTLQHGKQNIKTFNLLTVLVDVVTIVIYNKLSLSLNHKLRYSYGGAHLICRFHIWCIHYASNKQNILLTTAAEIPCVVSQHCNIPRYCYATLVRYSLNYQNFSSYCNFIW